MTSTPITRQELREKIALFKGWRKKVTPPRGLTYKGATLWIESDGMPRTEPPDFSEADLAEFEQATGTRYELREQS